MERLETRTLLANFTPGDVATLIDNINTANGNAQDDVIDLGGLTFTLNAIDNDPGGPNAGDAANGLPVIGADGGRSLTITGGTIERDQAGGTPEFRILSVGGGADLTIQDTVIQGGDLSTVSGEEESGGGIRNGGTLTVIDSTVTDNRVSEDGGGVYSTSTLTIIGSSITSNAAGGGGGGLASFGTTTIVDSTIADSTAGGGGGIVNFGTMTTVSNTTISGNSGTQNGGGVRNVSGTLALVNVTISDNSAPIGGDVINSSGDLAVLNSTIAGNTGSNTTGGIRNDDFGSGSSTLTIHNSILSGNTGGDFSAQGTSTETGSSNLADDASFPGRIAAVTNFDATLADNGGPTLTHAILAGSNAIDAGNNALAVNPGPDAAIGGGDDTPLAVDQRSARRVAGGTVDIGAVEFATDRIVTNTNDDGAGSLREAIRSANLTPNTLDTILFSDGEGGTHNFHDATPDVITLTSGQPAITSDVTITGPGADLLTISGDDTSRVFDVANGDHDVTFDSLTIADGDAIAGGGNTNGGGIRNLSTGTVTIVDAAVTDNRGGGIYHDNGTLYIERSSIAGNTSSDGGGIFIRGGTVTIVDSSIDGNAAGVFGGGLRAFGGTLTVSGSTISGNSSNSEGGGIASSRPLTIINSTISGNMATGGGGGVFSGRSLVVSNSTITGNSANSGGGIVRGAGTITINNSIVSGNTANLGDDTFGGSITDTNSLIGGTVTDILNTTLADNGGPTLTHALVADSPAVNAGDNTLATETGLFGGNALTTDQRGMGFARILTGTVDIGAFEANVIVVTNTTDNDDGSADPGAGSADGTSLREAINAANAAAGPAIIEFSDTSAGGAVNFHDATPDTITLGGTQLEISSDLTITGPGADLLSINGGNASGVIEVQAGGNLTLQSTTVTGSNDVGLVIGPNAVGSITESTITGNAGAGAVVSSLGTSGAGQLTVSSSTISNNGGSGINTFGNLTVTNSTVSGNTDAGVFVAGGFDLGTLVLTNSTIANNGSFGLDGRGPTTIANTIIVSNGTTSGSADVNGGGITSSGFNLIGDEGTSTAFGANDTTGVAAATVLDLTLQDNGGPTPTHALGAGSPAIDAGNNALATEDGTPVSSGGTQLTTDQRGPGFARIVGGTVDIGAVEANVVNLSVSINSGSEVAETVINVTATTDVPVAGDQFVDLDVSNGAITAGDFVLSDDDPVAAGVQIEIPDGQISGSVTFTVQDDDVVETLVETATLTISNPSGGLVLGVTTAQDIDITDNDVARFEVDAVTVDEGAGTATLDVVPSNPVDIAVDIGVEFADRSATAGGTDYAATNTTLNFAALDTTPQQVVVTINDDGDVEPLEKLAALLSVNSVVGTRMVTAGTATVRIVDNDGAARFDSPVGRDPATGNWQVARSNGSQFTNESFGHWTPPAGWVDVNVANVDGDPHPDLVGRNPVNGRWQVARSDGSGFASQVWGTWAPFVNWVDVHVGDVNGDGNDDVVGRQQNNGNWWVALSDGIGSFVNQLWGHWTPVGWTDVFLSDVNDDGLADVVGRQQDNGNWWVGLSNGVDAFANRLWGGWAPIGWVDVNVADVNGDGTTDIVGRQQSNGNWWVALSNGVDRFDNQQWGHWTPAAWVDVNIADVNSDGNDDVVGRQQDDGHWWVALSNGTDGFVNQLWGFWAPTVAWVDVHFGDVTGDGYDDVVGREQSNGRWWIGRSNGTDAFNNEPWGIWDPAVAWTDVGILKDLLNV